VYFGNLCIGSVFLRCTVDVVGRAEYCQQFKQNVASVWKWEVARAVNAAGRRCWSWHSLAWCLGMNHTHLLVTWPVTHTDGDHCQTLIYSVTSILNLVNTI